MLLIPYSAGLGNVLVTALGAHGWCCCAGQAGTPVRTPSVCPLIGILRSSVEIVGLHKAQEMPAVSVAD